MRPAGTDTCPDLRALVDLDELLEVALIKAQLGHTPPSTLLELPAVEDTKRLVKEIRRVA